MQVKQQLQVEASAAELPLQLRVQHIHEAGSERRQERIESLQRKREEREEEERRRMRDEDGALLAASSTQSAPNDEEVASTLQQATSSAAAASGELSRVEPSESLTTQGAAAWPTDEQKLHFGMPSARVRCSRYLILSRLICKGALLTYSLTEGTEC